jgi:hypothetical protein
MYRRLGLMALLVLVTFATAAQSRSVHAHETDSTASLCTGQPQGAACSLVTKAVVAELPAPPAILALVRMTINPGVQFTDLSVPGPTVLLVETGTLTVDMSGETDEDEQLEQLEGFVERAPANGTPTPTSDPVQIASVGIFRITLQAGDRLLIPSDWPHAMRNDTGTPISILAAAVTPPEPATGGPAWPPAGAWPPGLPDGVKVRSLDAGYRAVTDLPRTDATEILVERVTLQSGTSLALGPGAPHLLTVENGVLSVQCAAACPARHKDSTSTVPASPSPVATGANGGTVTLASGESVLIPDAVQATISTDAGSGTGPVSLISVTVAPSNEDPGRQGEHAD